MYINFYLYRIQLLKIQKYSNGYFSRKQFIAILHVPDFIENIVDIHAYVLEHSSKRGGILRALSDVSS